MALTSTSAILMTTPFRDILFLSSSFHSYTSFHFLLGLVFTSQSHRGVPSQIQDAFPAHDYDPKSYELSPDSVMISLLYVLCSPHSGLFDEETRSRVWKGKFDSVSIVK